MKSTCNQHVHRKDSVSALLKKVWWSNTFFNNAKNALGVSTCCLHVVYMSPTCRLQVPVPDPSIDLESIKNVFRNQRLSRVFIKWKKLLQRVPTCPKGAHFGRSRWTHFCIVLDWCEAKALNNSWNSRVPFLTPFQQKLSQESCSELGVDWSRFSTDFQQIFNSFSTVFQQFFDRNCYKNPVFNILLKKE